MPSFTSIFSLAALAALAQAITITSPSRNGEWNSGETNTITWTSVSTDPTTIDIYLVHQASQPQTRDLLFSDIAVSQGSIDVSGLQLPTGEAYQINFVKPDSPEQIYAQSEQFDVSGVASSATSTLAGYTGPTFTPSTASSTASSTSSASSSAAETTGTSSLTSGSASASTTVSVSSTLTTSTGSSTTSTGSVAASTSTGTVSGTSTSGSASGTGSASSSASAAAASGNAATDMRASAPLAALVFGAFAMLA